jgi:hypothetical protein
MRTRAWRRYKLEIIVKRRLKKYISEGSWWSYITPNSDKIKNPIWSDEIGSQDSHFYKTGVTRRCDNRYEVKYSPNRKYSYYRDMKKNRDSFGTRELDKRQFLKILKENGLR